MLTIHKIPLRGGNVGSKEADTEIEAYICKWLHVGKDPQGDICVWALVAVDSPSENVHRRKWKVMVRGTGHDCGDVAYAEFIGTVVDGNFVWHVFAGVE